MFYIIFILVLAGSFFIGSFAFPQIIGSIQHRRTRSVGLTFYTITFWSAILIVITIIAHRVLANYLLAYYVGIVLPLLMTLGTKNIE